MNVCKTCGNIVKQKRLECGQCRYARTSTSKKEYWARNAEHRSKLRNNDITRGKQTSYHERSRAKAEIHLKGLFGDGENFMCQGCGFKSTIKRQFSLHHLNPAQKTGKFAQFLRRGNFLERLSKQEFKLLCENCHRLETPVYPKTAKLRARKLHIIIGMNKTLNCELCGFYSEEPRQFDLHHLGSKSFGVSSAIKRKPLQAAEEAKKCAVLCARCHQLTHYLEFLGSK
jgi:hypothetical protein